MKDFLSRWWVRVLTVKVIRCIVFILKYSALRCFWFMRQALLNNKVNPGKETQNLQERTKRVLRERITDLNVQHYGSATLYSACMSHRLNSSLHFLNMLLIYLFICLLAGPAPSSSCLCQHRQTHHNTEECLLLECYYLFMLPWSLPVHSRHCFSVSVTVFVKTVTLV